MTPTRVVDELSGYQPTQDEKTWAMIAHLSGIFSGFLIPLLLLLTKAKESAWVRKQTVEALNFHLVVFAAVKTYNGEPYRYPVTIRFLN